MKRPTRVRGLGLLAGASLLLLLGGCGVRGTAPMPEPEQIQSRLMRVLPKTVSDRAGWAKDIQVAFTELEIEPSYENLCSVLAVTEQESTFQVAPPVPGLAKIARAEIDRRAERLHIPAFLVRAALQLESPTGKTYAERLSAVRTEEQLNDLFSDFIGMVPLGRQLFGTFNPVHTGGPMQVSIDFAEEYAHRYPYEVERSIRDEVFSRRGGMFFGIAHLLDYPAHYERSLYRYADFNAGWYASRNAAFQNAVARLSGRRLALDGDLIRHGTREPGQTEQAVRSLSRKLELDDAEIRRALEQGDSLDFEETDLYEKVFAVADKAAGKRLPRALVPNIALESPKITRKLTTAWFVERVDERRKRCLARAG